MSYSMELRGTWGEAKTTAMALHALVTTKYPQDAIEIIGFSDYAQVLSPERLAGLDAQRVQGTNLQHALVLAGRHLGKHPDSEPVVLVVTDGEPTAHLTRSGYAEFCWPPLPETLELTMAEVERVTRRGATINVFMLDDEPRLVQKVLRALGVPTEIVRIDIGSGANQYVFGSAELLARFRDQLAFFDAAAQRAGSPPTN